MAKRKRSSLSRRRRKQRQQQTRTILIVVGVITLGVIGAVVTSNSSGGGPEVAPERLALDPVLGSENATVTITEYGDFGCPSCRAWHNAGILDQLLATYGDNVQFVFKDFPVITAQSPRAAEAGQCALDQGQESFWAFHDTVYENYQGLGGSDLEFYATFAGLDVDAFSQCLEAGTHQQTVRADWNEARSLRLPGTPSFTINGRVIGGVPYFDLFAADIEAAINN